MDNIIRIIKDNGNYHLNYKELNEICYIGKNGLTKNKIEGDFKTPIGLFDLGIVFGIHKKEELSLNNHIEYYQINKNHFWIDDPNSKYYNNLVDITKVEKDWISAENLLDNKKPYEYAIEIKSNPHNIPGKGSAIFIHCKTKNYTAGCISIEKEKMKKLLASIDENTKILIW